MKNIKIKKELEKSNEFKKWVSKKDIELKKIELSEKWLMNFENKLEWFLWDDEFGI